MIRRLVHNDILKEYTVLLCDTESTDLVVKSRILQGYYATYVVTITMSHELVNVTLVMDRVAVHWDYSQEWDALVVFTDNDSK
jgi:hypothetical protein